MKDPKGMKGLRSTKDVMDGNQNVPNEFNVTVILLDQIADYSDTTLKVIVPSADCGFPLGIN